MRSSGAVIEELKDLSVANSDHTTNTQEGKWKLGFRPLPVLKTLRDKEPFSSHGGIQKERVIVPWLRRWSWVNGFRRSGI